MGWPEQRDGKWRGVYRGPDGRKRKTKTYRSKKRAAPAANDEEGRVREGTWFDPTAGRVTFSEYFERQWLPNRRSEINTRSGYRSQYNAKRHGLKVTFGDRELRKIRNSDVQGWVSTMIEDGMSAATIEARFITLQTVLAATKGASAMRDELIQENPCRDDVLFTMPDKGRRSTSPAPRPPRRSATRLDGCSERPFSQGGTRSSCSAPTPRSTSWSPRSRLA